MENNKQLNYHVYTIILTIIYFSFFIYGFAILGFNSSLNNISAVNNELVEFKKAFENHSHKKDKIVFKKERK